MWLVKLQPDDDADKTVDEWGKIKPLVVNAGYPRDRMVPLWNLISITKTNSQT